MPEVVEWQDVINDVLRIGAGQAANTGQVLWAGLAAIMVIWYGTQIALAGRGVDIAGFIEFVFGLMIPWGMLQFYTAAIPGLGLTTTDVLVGMGGWLQNALVADGGNEFWGEVMAFGSRMWGGLLGQPDGDANVFERIAGFLDALVKMVIAAPLVLLIWLVMLFVLLVGFAQVVWGYFGLALALAFGPIFIPWLMVPQLSWLFWGWFRTVLQYSFYGAVAAGIFRVVSQVGVATLQSMAEAPLLTEVDGVADFMIGISTGLLFAVASLLAMLKVGEFVQLLMSGSGSLSSGLGTRMMQASRLGGMAG